MSMPTYRIVCSELHAARGHLYSLVETLSQAELLWLPPRRDGITISYHFGHIALVEDTEMVAMTGKGMLATPVLEAAFGAHNVTNSDARLPSAPAILDYMHTVRERTLAEVALCFRAIRDDAAAVEAAEPFRRMINHEYSHTKYIRRIRAEMDKPPVDPPASDLVVADAQAIAPPQYSIPHW